MQRKNKLLSIVLATTMTVAMIPMIAFADTKGDVSSTETGSTAQNVRTVYDDWDADSLGALVAGEDTVTIDGVTYTYGGDESDGVYLRDVTENTIFKVGGGYIAYAPGTTENKAIFHEITAEGIGGDAVILLANTPTTVLLEGENSITSTSNNATCLASASSSVAITGDGKLLTHSNTGIKAAGVTIDGTTVIISYTNGYSGIISTEDLEIKNSYVKSESNGTGTATSAGAIYGHKNITITDSKVILNDEKSKGIMCKADTALNNSRVIITGGDTTGLGVLYSNGLSVSGGDLFLENTSGGANLYAVTKTTSNSARIYVTNTVNYNFQSGSSIQYGGCTYDESVDEITVGEGYNGSTYIYGDYVWSEETPDVPSGRLSIQKNSSVTIPEGVMAQLPKISILGTSALTNNGTVIADIISNQGELINNGSIETPLISNYGTCSGDGEFNTMIMTGTSEGGKKVYTYTVVGNAEYSPSNIDFGAYSDTEDDIISVPEGATLIISDRDTLDAGSESGITLDTLSRYLKVSGAIVNKGKVILPEGATSETVKEQNLTGGGIVLVETAAGGEKAYTNDGTPLTTIESLDLTGSVTNGNGVNWNADSNTLELEDVYIDGGIKLPEADTTIIIKGHVKVDISIYRVAGAAQGLTIKKGSEGATLSADISTQGDVELNGITLFSDNISNGNTSGNNVLTIKDSTVEAGTLSWMTDGGVNVINSTLAAGTYGNGDSQFWTEKLVMDDASIINVIAPISNYGHLELDEALGGIEKYLPEGYKLEKVGEWNTIVDSEGNPAYGFTLKVATTDDNPGQEDGNKPSGENGQDNDGNSTNNGTNAGTTTTPGTGDYEDTYMWFALILAAGFVTFMTVRFAKREDR